MAFHDASADRGSEAAFAASRVDLERFNIADPALFQSDVVGAYFARLRREDPVHLCPDSPFGRYWSVTRYEHIRTVDQNHEVFSSDFTKGGILILDTLSDFTLPMFIAMDPPRHTEQRKAVQPIVQGDNLAMYERLIRERTISVLEQLPRGEPFDWVDRVSVELTTMMLATLFGFPFEERRRLTRWSDVATGRNNRAVCASEEAWRAEMMECLGCFSQLFADRKGEGDGNDLISMLARGEATREMPPMEFLGNILLLIVGGNDTTRNSMTGSVYGLNKFPMELEKLRNNPALIPSMVSEIIRWQTPLAHMRRTALADVELGGKAIRAGEKVVMWYVSGNRDESQFERPDDIVIDRANVRSHLSFGFGIHRCVGNRLAEMQLRILWEELLQRFKTIEVLAEPMRTPSVFVRGYTKMDVIVT
jgi:cytochrome P450